MGYTHYWYRKPTLPKKNFQKVVRDLKLVAAYCDRQFRTEDGTALIPLGDGHGENFPIFTDKEIIFNGKKDCGHAENKNLVLPWPTTGEKHTGGVAGQAGEGDNNEGWYGGSTVSMRCCNGSCSYETFWLPRIREKGEFGSQEKGKIFDFTKTAYRPYDLIVNCALLIAKNHLGDDIDVSTDGEKEHWQDAIKICAIVLEDVFDFEISKKDGNIENLKIAGGAK